MFPLTLSRSCLALTDGGSIDEFYEYDLIKDVVDELLKNIDTDHSIPSGWHRALFRGQIYRNMEPIMEARQA